MLEEETKLVQQLRDGDAGAMARFCRRYRAALFNQVHRLVRDRQTAEDVLQEGLLRIWLAMPAYDPARGRLFAWTARICSNAAVDYLRSRAAHQSQRTRNLESLVAAGAEPAAPVAFWPEHIGLADLLAQLRPEHRQALELLYFGGFTHAEAAAELNVPLGTVKTWASAGKRHLARLL